MQASHPANPSLLVIFDFDHSLVDENSDTFILDQLSPKLRKELLDKYDEIGGWTESMNYILNKLHAENFKKSDVEGAICKIPLFPALKEKLVEIHSSIPSMFCIMSDANSMFIETVLRHQRLDNVFQNIFTNPAQFDHEERLSLQPLVKSDTPHGCTRCEINICKGFLVQNVHSKQPFRRTVYVGDGTNDYCPATRLGENDVLLPRHGFSLHKILQSPYTPPLKCKIMVWKDYGELVSHFAILLEEERKGDRN